MANNTHPSSVEAAVTNNVFVPHPTSGDLVPMGMIIQQETITINDREVSGHKVIALETGSLSDKATLRVNDLLVALDEQFFIDNQTTESVQKLFETRSKKFSMTLIRQDKDATSDIAKYQTRTITIELRDDKDLNVKSDDEEHRVKYTGMVKMKIWQEGPSTNITMYLKAVGDRNVAMATQHSYNMKKPYLFKVYIYESWPTADDHACTFLNEMYKSVVTGKPGKEVVMEAANPVPPTDPVIPTAPFFYYRPTGVLCEYGFESVLKKDHYITADSKDSGLKLIKQKKPLNRKSIFCMTFQK